MEPYEALAMILDCGLTKEQYKKIRVNSLRRNACIYPAYEKILEVKELCQPPNTVKTPEVVTCPMQDVLNHQVVLPFWLPLYLYLIWFSIRSNVFFDIHRW